MTYSPRRRSDTASEPRDHYADVTAQIIAALEAGTPPWRRPWNRERCSTLPELQSKTVEPKALAPAAAVTVTHREILPEVVPPMPVAVAIRGTKPCCWPIGEPGTRLFRFCNAPNESGKPYCPDHCGIAYRKKEPRQKAA